MTELVQIALAATIDEAEEIRLLLKEAGIDATVEPAVEHDPEAVHDLPQRILVQEHDAESAREAVEALTEPGEIHDA